MISAWLPIGGLLLLRCPIPISRLIISVIIFSVYREFRLRTPSHIRNKCLEAISPTLANFYSPSSIAKVTLMFSVLAPCDHSGPDIVLWPSAPIASGAMRKSCSSRLFKFNKQTSATSDRSRNKIPAIDGIVFPAFTEACPSYISGNNVCVSTNYGKSSESLSGQVSNWWHCMEHCSTYA